MSINNLHDPLEEDEEDLGLQLKGLKLSKYLSRKEKQDEESDDLDVPFEAVPKDEDMDLSTPKHIWRSSQEQVGNIEKETHTKEERNSYNNEEDVDLASIGHSQLSPRSIPSYTQEADITSERLTTSSTNEDATENRAYDTTITEDNLEFQINGELIDKPQQDLNESDVDSDSSEWDTVPAIASYDVYNDKGELQLEPYAGSAPNSASTISLNKKASHSKEDIKDRFGYTKVAAEAQAQRSYQSNKKTDFLFEHKKLLKLKSINNSTASVNSSTHSASVTHSLTNDSDDEFYDEYEDGVEPMDDINRESQLNVTKLLLNDMDKFAYLGAVNVIANQMCTDLATLCLCIDIKQHKKLASRLHFTQKDMAAWKITTLTRLYDHLQVSEEEIQMIEKLSLHNIEVSDLLKCLKTTQSIENPFEKDSKTDKSNENTDESNEDIEELNENKDKLDKDTDKTNYNVDTNPDDEVSNIDKNPFQDPKNETHSAEENRETDDEIPPPYTSVYDSDKQEVINPDAIRDKDQLNIDVAWTVICDLFLLLLQNSSYDSRSRTLLIKFGEALNITNLEICEFEKRVTDSLDMEQSTDEQVWDEQKHMKDRRKRKRRRKMYYVGLAMVGGSLVLGLSGGFLAPVIGAGIAAGLSTAGITGAAGFLTGAGGTAVVALSSTAIGANIGARGMSKRMGSVRTFEFRPLHNNRRVNLIISVSGWIIGNEDDVRLPFSTVDPVEGDLYSLYWEPEMLKSTGQTINIVASEVFTQTIQQVLGATILTAFVAAIQWPMALSKLGYMIDNPWNVSLDRAWYAGLIMADTLITRNLGERPVTLVGFSLGSSVIYSCLIELCKKKALGLVENIFIFGTPVVRKKEQLVMARSVVSGRFVNAYSDKDWVLAYLFRATAGGFSAVMGISPVEDVEGVENFNCTELVDGHMAYRKNMPKLLKHLGISVLAEEFVEIQEDMDPDEARKHRKLVHDVDAAQKKLLSRKKHNSWMPRWMKRKKSKWRVMVEDVVEEKDIENEELNDEPEATDILKPKKKDAALVDHGALMYELQQLKAAMRKNELEDEENKKVENEANEVKQDITQEADNKSLPRTPDQRNVNNFQLLSAGRTILPEDEDVTTQHDQMTFEFPDDI